jgi:hypothetical protein
VQSSKHLSSALGLSGLLTELLTTRRQSTEHSAGKHTFSCINNNLQNACVAAGGQRYAAHWTGDNVSSWEHYRMNFPMVINMGLSGYCIAGAHAISVACQTSFQH